MKCILRWTARVLRRERNSTGSVGRESTYLPSTCIPMIRASLGTGPLSDVTRGACGVVLFPSGSTWNGGGRSAPITKEYGFASTTSGGYAGATGGAPPAGAAPPAALLAFTSPVGSVAVLRRGSRGDGAHDAAARGMLTDDAAARERRANDRRTVQLRHRNSGL